MARITELSYEATGRPGIICDYSPPRSGHLDLAPIAALPVDVISVAYNPGRSVRANSVTAAAAIKERAGRDVAFTLATRDMNLLALQSQLLGAQMLGLENVIVVQGDAFTQEESSKLTTNNDLRPTELIAGIAAMNRGLDFRGGRLDRPTDFCVGATVDLGRGIKEEAPLAYRKVTAGAEFLITQPIFDVSAAVGFLDAYRAVAGHGPPPIFFGLQVHARDGISFADVPDLVREQLERGCSGVDLAADLYREFRANGLHDIYLVPPIHRGGARDYDAARRLVERVR